MFSTAQVIIFILSLLMNDGSVSQSAKIEALTSIKVAIEQNLQSLNGGQVVQPEVVAPVLGSAFEFNPIIANYGERQVSVTLPEGTVSGTVEMVSSGSYNRNLNLKEGFNVIDGGLYYRRPVKWTITANVNGTNYSKSGSFIYPIGKTECTFSKQDACDADEDIK